MVVPTGLPGGLGSLGGVPQLPPGTKMPDLSKLKLPKRVAGHQVGRSVRYDGRSRRRAETARDRDSTVPIAATSTKRNPAR